MAVHLAILNYMASERVAPLLLRGHLHGYASIAEYTTAENMDKMTVGAPRWRRWHWPTCYTLLCVRMFPSMVHGTSTVQPVWKHTAMCFQSPCTSDIHTVDHFDVVSSV